VAKNKGAPYEDVLRQGGEGMLREASAYFDGSGRLHGALHRLADVQDLIIRRQPPLSFGDALDPSVQGAYQDLWNKAQKGTA